MAETKQIGKLENLITFKIDKTSFDAARKKIQQIKNEMKGISKPLQEALKPARAAQKMKSDYLVVQKQLDKVEKQQLKTAEALAKARNKQALAEQKIQNQRRAQSVRGLTAGAGAGKASQSLFADMLRQEERDAKRAANLQNTLNNRNLRVDRRAQATQEWFGSTFGRGGQRKATNLYNDMRAGRISAEQYATRLRSLRAELYRNQRAQRSFNQSIHDMRGAFIQATASYTACAGVMGIANIGKKFQGYQSAMSMAFGGKEEGQKQSQYAMGEIYRLGLDTQSGMDNYSKLAVAAKGKLKTSDLQNLFSGYSEYAKVAGASEERISNGVVALQQMLSKGRITAEEFRNQMAEQIVGSDIAFRKAVEEMIGRALEKGELEKMMSKGLLDPEQLFPLVGKYFSLLAKEGGALQEKLLQLETIETRMKTSFTQWMNATYSGGLSEGLTELYQLLDNIFWAMSQGDSASGGFLKGFLGAARDSIAAINDALNDLVLFVRYKLGIEGADAEFLGKVTYWIAIAGAMNTVAGLMKIIFGGSMLSMIVKVSAAMSSLVALPFAIVAGLQTLYDKLGWIQDPNAVAQQSGAIKQMTNQALVSGMPMFAQPYFQQQMTQAQNQNGQIIVKLETTSDVDKLIQGHIETNNQKVIQSFVPMGWTSTSN